MKEPNLLINSRDYKDYLSKILVIRSETERGQRLRLARHIGCNPSYITQVLNGLQDLTPEQAQATSEFLGHVEFESRYFLNLVLWSRAGTQSLKKYYLSELTKMKEQHSNVRQRLNIQKSLGLAEQAQYYRVWFVSAIHMIAAIPQCKTREKISQHLQLPQKTVNETVDFLLSIGLLTESGKGQLQRSERSLIVGSDSPFLVRHQANWHLKALQNLENQASDELFFSGVITCSQADIPVLREILLRAIQEMREIIKESPDEVLAAYNIDLFRVRK